MIYDTGQQNIIFDFVCSKIAEEGDSLRRVIRDNDTIEYDNEFIKMPALSTFMKWLSEDSTQSEHYRAQYRFALSCREELFFDDLIDIADDDTDHFIDEAGNTRIDSAAVGKKTLRTRNRMWVLSRMNPKKYGDKLDLKAEVSKVKPLRLVKPPSRDELNEAAKDNDENE